MTDDERLSAQRDPRPNRQRHRKNISIAGERAGICASTVTDALPLLFAGFGSGVVAAAVAVLVTVVPAVAL